MQLKGLYNKSYLSFCVESLMMLKILPAKSKFTIYIILILLLAVTFFINIVYVINSLGGLYDFGSFVGAGQLAKNGLNPYSTESPLINSIKFRENDPSQYAPNLNPPITVLIFKNIVNINPLSSITFWRICSLLFFIAAIIMLQRTYPAKGFQAFMQFAWALSLAGFWHTLHLGQIYTFMLILLVMAWMLFKNNKPVAAGIFLGIVIAIKPNFILLALLLCVAGNWQLFLSAGVTAASISAIPLITNGFGIYRQWLEASLVFTPNMLVFPGNNSFEGLSVRFGSIAAGVTISLLSIILLIFYIYNSKPNKEKVISLGILISLLASPIAWTGYTILALPIFFSRKQWSWPFWFAAAILSVPFLIPLNLFILSSFNFVFFGWFYGWGLLVLLSGILSVPTIRIDKVAAMTNNIQTN